jgi:mono/diheme cytochrome c family protein
MKRYGLLGSIFIAMLLVLVAPGNSSQHAAAFTPAQTGPDIPRGGALFDNWFQVLGKSPPTGDMPIWSRQTTNTLSGQDTWRCVTCHGWDYQGKDGAYRSGSNYTGFPSVYKQVQDMSEDEIVTHLKGSKDPSHNFSSYIDDASLKDLATFLKTALIDDSQYIDPVTLKVIDGDTVHGKDLYDQQCADCHGADGQKKTFRFEGQNATLGTLAVIDPWRFLHKTRFGTPGTPMVIGYTLGWKPQDGRDVLLYAQSLPGGSQKLEKPPVIGEGPFIPPLRLGGPAGNFFSGILTALAAIGTALGFALLLGAGAVGIIFVLVWLIRGRK